MTFNNILKHLEDFQLPSPKKKKKKKDLEGFELTSIKDNLGGFSIIP